MRVYRQGNSENREAISGCSIFHYEAASNGPEGPFDSIHMRAVVRVAYAADSVLADAQSFGELGLGDALLAHSSAEGNFGGGDRRKGDGFLSILNRAGEWDVLPEPEVRAQCGDERIFGQIEGLGPIFARGESASYVWKGHVESPSFLGIQVARIDVSHCQKSLLAMPRSRSKEASKLGPISVCFTTVWRSPMYTVSWLPLPRRDRFGFSVRLL